MCQFIMFEIVNQMTAINNRLYTKSTLRSHSSLNEKTD